MHECIQWQSSLCDLLRHIRMQAVFNAVMVAVLRHSGRSNGSMEHTRRRGAAMLKPTPKATQGDYGVYRIAEVDELFKRYREIVHENASFAAMVDEARRASCYAKA